MHFSPILALKAPKRRFPYFTLSSRIPKKIIFFGILGEIVKLENAILGFSRAEMVRNTCFQSNIVSVTYDLSIEFVRKSNGINESYEKGIQPNSTCTS